MSDNRSKEARRDASIHRGSFLTGDAPKPIDLSRLKGRKPVSDLSQTGIGEVMDSLRSMGIDPTKPLEKTEHGDQK